MAKVYRVSGINAVYYYGRKRPALACKPDGDHPEGFDVLDAEADLARLRHLLSELYDSCGAARRSTAGVRAAAAIKKYDPEAARQMGIE